MSKLSSRKCYLALKPPGSNTNIDEDSIPKHLKNKDPEKQESEKGYNNFVVVENIIKNIEWLYLSSSGHKRLLINLNNKDNKFQWLIP